jgi:CheY-like chemotaxis protein
MKLKPIFYVEDDENDTFLMRRALKKCGIENPLVIASDGQEAIDFLESLRESARADSDSLPCLILLDLNLPNKNGHEVLQWIRKNSAFRTLVVIILSSSSHDKDIHRAYASGANAYIVKPSVVDDLMETVNAIHAFWLKQNHSPPAVAAEPQSVEEVVP